PGRCELSLDIRAGDEATRDAAAADVLAEAGRIGVRRQVTIEGKEIQRSPVVPCSAALQVRLATAVERAGIHPRHLPRGAGPDAVGFSGTHRTAMPFLA